MNLTSCSIFLQDFADSGILSIAYYSHLIPTFIALFIGLFVLFKSKYSLVSKVFFSFVGVFCLWLLGDLITWTTPSYYLISASWASLDYINILFFLFAGYFFIVLIREKDIAWWQKTALLALSAPAWWITITGQSMTGFYQPYCEAFNNESLTTYKFVIEMLVLAFIMFAGLFSFARAKKQKRKQIAWVGLALILFLGAFSSTEYIASQTGIYEINLYSLFVLPVFLGMIIFSITNLRIFEFKSFGTQLLTTVMLIMVGSQFFFLENSTDRILTIVTFILSVFLGIVLFGNVRREEKARIQIEKLAEELKTANDRLRELDKMKSEFLSFASHQLRSPLTAIEGYTSMLLEGDFGEMSEKVKSSVHTIDQSSKSLITIVNEFLDVSRIEQGRMKYDYSDFDIKSLAEEVVAELRPNVEAKGLSFEFTAKPGDYMVHADRGKVKQVIGNIVDNSIKYTPSGGVKVRAERIGERIQVSITDTGIGIDPSEMGKLFSMFSRAKDAHKTNVSGTGLGLFVAKQMIEAMKGRVWVESRGKGKGSTFFIELPAKN